MSYLGLYSAKGRAAAGSSLYSTPDGRTVEVTAVWRPGVPWRGRYMWDDTLEVGPVCKFVRRVGWGRAGKPVSMEDA